MRNSLILMCGLLMISVSANACEGITVTGKSGKTYCLSKHKMNWYSAYAWCQGQGMQLFDMETVCGIITGTCTELKLSADEQANITNNGGTVGWVWSNTSYNSSNAHNVSLSSGYIGNNGVNRDNTSLYYALCF